MSEFKHVIRPDLLKALEFYAQGNYSPLQPSCLRLPDSNGKDKLWSLEDTCEMAHRVLANEELNLLKLQALKAGMKAHGIRDLYEKILGEKI